MEPIIIERSETQSIQIQVKEYKGKKYLDIRIFFLGDNGEWLPTKKGVTFNEKTFPEFKEAINKIKEVV